MPTAAFLSCRACKPNSVPARSAHRSSVRASVKRTGGGRSFLWAVHYCAALATYPGVVTRRAGTFPAVPAVQAQLAWSERTAGSGAPTSPACGLVGVSDPPLFGLAPCGVYPATAIAGGAVRSYRTFSPLPRPTTATHGGFERARLQPCRLPTPSSALAAEGIRFSSRIPRCALGWSGGAVCFLWHWPSASL